MDSHFEVKFESGRPAFARIPGSGNAFEFHGKGSLVVSDDGVTLCGRPRSLFHSGPIQKHQFPMSNIWNVRQVHKRLAFDVNVQGGQKATRSGFTAKSREEAEQIATLLPKQQTVEFVHERAAWREFDLRLRALSPRPLVSLLLIAMNVIIFLAMAFSGVGFIDADASAAVAWGTNYSPLTVSGQWWRLLTSIFIHFGLVHIALNMWSLLVIGPLAERLFGSGRFLLLYLLAGICGQMASLLWYDDINGAGASGAIFALLGAILAFLLNRKNAVPRIVTKTMLKPFAIVVGLNLFIGFSISRVDNAAHIGGLVAGLLLGFVLAPSPPFGGK